MNWKTHPATVRQLKVIRFFGVRSPIVTKGDANRFISAIFRDTENRTKWNKYIFLTGDTSDESPELKPFNPAELEQLVLPENWENKTPRLKNSFSSRAELIWAEGSPFDDPEPELIFSGKKFCFTGKFEFGTRKACQLAVENLGSISHADVTHDTDYLIVGKLGSDRFAKEGYGRKIEWAIIAKFEHGSPLLISEDHWASYLRKMSMESEIVAPL